MGVYDKGLDYLSFRHGVTTKLYAAGWDTAVVDTLTGHEGTGTSQKVYLKTLPLPKLYEAVCSIEWPELDGLLVSPSLTSHLISSTGPVND